MNRNALQFGAHYSLACAADLDGQAAPPYQALLKQLAEMDRLGYDHVWVSEHHFVPDLGTVPKPPTLMAAIARMTKRIRLGVALDVLSLQNPIEIAESYAMVDVVSDGRLEFGVGSGSELHDNDKAGAHPEAAGRVREVTEIVCQAWSGQPVNFRGAFFNYENVPVMSKPVQQPHPPIWVGCAQGEETFRWAGVKGFHVITLPHLYPEPRLLSALVKTYRRALAKAGHDFTATEVLGRFHIYVSQSLDRALREAEPYLRHDLATPDRADPAAKSRENLKLDRTDQVAHGFAIVGDPERCIDSIRRWREEAGLTAFSFAFHFGGMPEEMALTSIRLFAERVMPQFK